MMVALVPGLSVVLSSCEARDPGARVFARKCAGCHGKDGSGDPVYRVGRPDTVLTDGAFRHGADPKSVRRVISDGPGKGPMPAFRGRLTEAEIDAVTRHVLALVGSPSPATTPGSAPTGGER